MFHENSHGNGTQSLKEGYRFQLCKCLVIYLWNLNDIEL